ncbi:hypothetical protein ACFWRV_01525 [Streptomyces sp. NPDC058576]|uniref:glycoside hydrolase family 113 n=1 Tax=Streptomyces sp. NPDC058576 TaxID=3346547 RepID=UPI003651EDC4
MTNRLAPLHRGYNFGYLAPRGYYASPEAAAEVDAMAEAGAKSVALMVTVMQETFASTRLYQDFEYTASDEELARIIEHIHGRGMQVLLKPVVECQDSAWRGRITFPRDDRQIQGRYVDYWARWFDSYAKVVRHYGALAERTGCALFSVGCELQGMDDRIEHWSRIIAEARQVFSGPLTTQVNDPALVAGADYAWLRELDVLSISFYKSSAPKPGASVAEMKAHLAPQVAGLRALAEEYGLAILFNESGCRSLHGAATDPGDYRPSGAYSGQEQADFAEALLSSFWNEDWWRGLYWWKWEEQQRRPHYYEDPAGDSGFTVRGKPAADVIARWYTRTDR